MLLHPDRLLTVAILMLPSTLLLGDRLQAQTGGEAAGRPPSTSAPDSQASPFQRPAYHFLRQREDWSDLANRDRRQTGDWWDRLKYTPLTDDGDVWMSIGGHARLRFENHDGFAFGAPPQAQHSDSFLLSRLVVHSDIHIGEHLRTFVELKTVQSTGRDLPGGNRTSDIDSADVQQAFVDLRAPVLPGWGELTLRTGRQALQFGAQRLVSPLPWGNTLRSWDGIAAILEEDRWKVTAFATHFAPVQKYSFNDTDHGTDFWGIYSEKKPGEGDLGCGWDLYLLGLNRDSAAFNGTGGDEERITLGTRAHGKSGAFDYDGEFAYQFGDLGVADISAFMLGLELGLKLPSITESFRAFAGFDYASGDDSVGGNVQTFNQLFPLGHAYLGLIDAIGRQNIIDVSGGFSLATTERSTLRFAYHAFWLADKQDALYNPGGAVLRPGNSSEESFVGDEIDITWRLRIDSHTGLLLGYSHFFAGDMLEASGPSDDWDFAYAQLTYTF